LLNAVALVAEPIHLAFLWRPAFRDPDDDAGDGSKRTGERGGDLQPA
jgi:hypothetical protein